MSFCTRVTSAAYTIPTIDRPATHQAAARVASGRSGSEKRRNPYVPIFRSTPARITEPAVGACTCASGSQVWNGNIGTLMAKPRKKARKHQNCSSPGIAIVYHLVTSKVAPPGSVDEWKYRARMATSITTEPTSVYRKNLIAA